MFGDKKNKLKGKTTSYIYEWLFMKALEKENLFSLGVDYVDVKIFKADHFDLYAELLN